MNTTNISADMPSESSSGEQNANIRAKKMLLYLAIFSMVMFFAGLTSAYVVLMKGEYWVKIGLPNAFWISTALILISSLTFKLAVDATTRENQKLTQMWLLVTLLLGGGFAASQFQGWNQLIERGHFVSGSIESISGNYGQDYTIVFKGKELVLVDGKFFFPDDDERTESLNERVLSKSNTASSFIYVLSGLHLLHLAGGLLFLIYLVIKSFRVQVSASHNLGYKQGATYWHFLDILWVYLFLFLLFIH